MGLLALVLVVGFTNYMKVISGIFCSISLANSHVLLLVHFLTGEILFYLSASRAL
jgi:hypothetical protein